MNLQTQIDGGKSVGGTKAYIQADYEEFEPQTYRAITVEINGEVRRFEQSPLSAYRHAVDYAQAHADKVFEMSSLDNLCSDMNKEHRK